MEKFRKIPPAKIKAWVASRFPYRERKDGTELVLNNPLTYDDGEHFSINIEKAVCGDWRGNEWAGPVTHTGKRNTSFVNFVSKVLKCSIREALRSILGDQVHVYSSSNQQTNKPDPRIIAIPPEFKPINADTDDQQALISLMYLLKRGYTAEEIEKANLHVNGVTVLWPYYEFGELVYWQSRSVINKTFNFPTNVINVDGGKIGKSDFLYGFDDCEPNKYLILVEAIFDKMTLGDQCCAIGGAMLTDKQVRKVCFLKPKSGIILAIDNDLAGRKSILSNQSLLQPHGYKILYSFPPKVQSPKSGELVKDWNECITELKWTKQDIRNAMVQNIKLLDLKGTVAMTREISALEKEKRNN
jgi:hypothetical protein